MRPTTTASDRKNQVRDPAGAEVMFLDFDFCFIFLFRS
ncbi:hypothetical protein SXCC_00584 [Gluconacetobacter sp. SXCC-1]|nr:hypothetical protein SXCC_00584 [Gluconacetobacter sp. SXCC-1]